MQGYQEHIKDVQSGRKGLNPYIDTLGIQVQQAANGQSVMRMSASKDFLQGASVLQGGIIGSLADEAMAYALLSQTAEQNIIATVDIAHTHLGPVFKGELEARAKVVKQGKRMAFTECEVYNGENLVLRSHASFMILPKK